MISSADLGATLWLILRDHFLNTGAEFWLFRYYLVNVGYVFSYYGGFLASWLAGSRGLERVIELLFSMGRCLLLCLLVGFNATL